MLLEVIIPLNGHISYAHDACFGFLFVVTSYQNLWSHFYSALIFVTDRKFKLSVTLHLCRRIN